MITGYVVAASNELASSGGICSSVEMDLDKTIVAAKDQVAVNISGELVILDLKSGVYYGLNLLGTVVWDLVQTPTRVERIRDAILEEYDVTCSQCEDDLLQLLDELMEVKLVEIAEEQGS